MIFPSDHVILRFNVPLTHADEVRKAAGEAGSGRLGNYSFCSFSVRGMGRFLPSDDATPFLGAGGVLEEVEEEQIETYCHVSILENVIEAIKKAHPYEEMAIEIQPLYDMGRKKAADT